MYPGPVTHTDDSVTHTEPPFSESDSMKAAAVVLMLAVTATVRPCCGQFPPFSRFRGSPSGFGTASANFQSGSVFGNGQIRHVTALTNVSNAGFLIRVLVTLRMNR